jgi:hypothetical protein
MTIVWWGALAVIILRRFGVAVTAGITASMLCSLWDDISISVSPTQAEPDYCLPMSGGMFDM